MKIEEQILLIAPESCLFITGTHFLLSTTTVRVSREGEEWECALLLWMWCSEDSSWNTSNSIRQHLQTCLRSVLGLRDNCLDNCLWVIVSDFFETLCLWFLQVLLIVFALQFSFTLPPARKSPGTAVLCTFSFISVHRSLLDSTNNTSTSLLDSFSLSFTDFWVYSYFVSVEVNDHSLFSTYYKPRTPVNYCICIMSLNSVKKSTWKMLMSSFSLKAFLIAR